MYELKKIPEDFVVKEEPLGRFEGEGIYQIFLMRKKNYNTEDAIQQISRSVNIPRKFFGYAGTKDRNAITYQYISIRKTSPKKIESLQLKDIELKHVGMQKGPLSLGDLKGNHFDITIRNLLEEKIKVPEKLINYFDEQRFSKNNIEIGRKIVKKNFEGAAKMLADENSTQTQKLKKHLEENPNDYSNALKTLPKKTLQMYIHSYQSYIWNLTVKKYVEKNPATKQKQVPLIGFGHREREEFKDIIEEILEKEDIIPRDFIIRALPFLSAEGTERELFMEAKDLQLSKKQQDELNNGKSKIRAKFFLPKGSYATMVIKQLFGEVNLEEIH